MNLPIIQHDITHEFAVYTRKECWNPRKILKILSINVNNVQSNLEQHLTAHTVNLRAKQLPIFIVFNYSCIRG